MSETDPIKLYMREVSQYRLITPQEEIEYAERIKEGDQRALEDLVNANLRLVVKIAHEFKWGLPLLDLIAHGNYGLMTAAEKFDPEKGAKFSSYASWWIKQGMRRAINDEGRAVRVPINTAGKGNKLRTFEIEFEKEHDRPPSKEEVLEHFSWSPRTLKSARKGRNYMVSLDATINGEKKDQLFHNLVPDESAETVDILNLDEKKALMRNNIHCLDDRERLILILRFGLDGSKPKTLEEVSEYIERTRERVRQVELQALKKLGDFMATNEHAPTISKEEAYKFSGRWHPWTRKATQYYLTAEQNELLKYLNMKGGYETLELLAQDFDSDAQSMNNLITSIKQTNEKYTKFRRTIDAGRKPSKAEEISQKLIFTTVYVTDNGKTLPEMVNLLLDKPTRQFIQDTYGVGLGVTQLTDTEVMKKYALGKRLLRERKVQSLTTLLDGMNVNFDRFAIPYLQ